MTDGCEIDGCSGVICHYLANHDARLPVSSQRVP
jgi:hypothetical protein